MLDSERRLLKLEAEAARLRKKELRARRKAERIEREIQVIRLVIGAPRGERPHYGVNAPEGPIGVAAIRRLLGEAPDRVWSAGLLHEELEKRGWVSPVARHRLQGTEAALSRLVRSGELERVARGRYRLISPGPASRRSLVSRPGLGSGLVPAEANA